VSELRFRLLGPLEADRDGVPLDLGARKQRAVLALLLLEANRVVSTERLIDELWGDDPPETARSALQVYVAGLRKALGDDGASLRTRAPGYVLDVPAGRTDLDDFARLRADARPHEALALWRGPALADLDGEPFAAAAAGRLEEQRLAVVGERVDADLALGRHAELVPELETLVAEHPYRERFRAQLMLALYRSGRQADALAAYREARQALVEGLGIEPGEELRGLERAVLDQDPALAAPMTRPSAARIRRSRLRIAAGALLALAGAVAALLLLRDESAPLVAEPNSVAVIDPASNEVVATVPVGLQPASIAAGGGAVWAANLEGRSLTRIDPGERTVVETVALDATPTGVAFAAGHVWTAHGLTGELTRIDPELGGKTTLDVARTRIRRSVGAVAGGPSGVWVVYGDATLARVGPRSLRIAWTFAGSSPTAVVDGGGSVWVTSSGSSTALYRFNPLTFRSGPIGRAGVGPRPTAVAYGHGAVWVTSWSEDFVTRVDPGSYAGRSIAVGDEPVAVAVGAGSVWVANGGDGTVSRIEPATRQVVDTIEVGNAPAGIVVSRGLVWVTVQAP
jgi:YVTN family beta-propeller protein